MYLRYGSYTHQLDEAAVQISKARQFSKNGSLVGYNETWRVTGKIVGTDTSDLTTKISELEAAYSKTNQDLSLLTDALGTTAHVLRSSDTANGIKPISLSYPTGDGAEYTTFRTYEIVLEARFDAEEGNGDQNNTVAYSQQISVQGTGGPQFVVKTPRYGPPIYQMVSRQSPIYITQSGSATGLRYHPQPTPPLYPQFLVPDSHNVTRVSPATDSREGKRDFAINWSYNFIMVR